METSQDRRLISDPGIGRWMTTGFRAVLHAGLGIAIATVLPIIVLGLGLVFPIPGPHSWTDVVGPAFYLLALGFASAIPPVLIGMLATAALCRFRHPTSSWPYLCGVALLGVGWMIMLYVGPMNKFILLPSLTAAYGGVVGALVGHSFRKHLWKDSIDAATGAASPTST